jgi:hypothetical protein
MKTLTKISAATLMGLLAVVLSSSAFAGKPNDASVEIFNDCQVKTVDKYGDPVPPQLIITTTIEDTSDDSPGVPGNAPELGDISAYPVQKGMKAPGTRGPNRFEPLGAGVSQGAVMSENILTVYLCLQDPPLLPTANVLNAEIFVEVNNSRKGGTYGSCDDDPTTYCSYLDADGNEVVYYCEDQDESIVNVDPGICL